MKSKEKLVLYIAGTGHSGSTLLSFILNTHPDIFAIGEMHAPLYPRSRPRERLCSCGARLGECQFFTEMTRCFHREGIRFDPCRWDLLYNLTSVPLANRLMTGSLRSNALERVRDRIWQLYPGYHRELGRMHRLNEFFVGFALAITRNRVFVDASKDPLRMVYLQQLRDIGLKVIHLVRDPRGHAYSYWKRGRANWLHRAVSDWLRTNRNVERHLAKLPSHDWIRVRYESLCTDPKRTLHELVEFLGVRAMKVPSNYRSATHHIMGNHMRLPSDGRSTIQLDEGWRRELPSQSLDMIWNKAGKLGRKYGYTQVL